MSQPICGLDCFAEHTQSRPRGVSGGTCTAWQPPTRRANEKLQSLSQQSKRKTLNAEKPAWTDPVPRRAWGRRTGSAQTDLGEDALAGEQFGGQADHEAEHGESAVPGFSELHKTEAGRGGVRHGWKRDACEQ